MSEGWKTTDLLILAAVFINRILCGQWFVYK